MLSGNEAYQAIKNCVYPWTIRRWGETKGTDGRDLVKVPELKTEEVRLDYTDDEEKWLAEWVQRTKENEKELFQAAVHDWRLACLSADLVTVGDTVPGPAESRATVFRTEWDRRTFSGRPIFRWLESTFLPILSKPAKDGPPNKAVVFAPLLGHTHILTWWTLTFHSEVLPIH